MVDSADRRRLDDCKKELHQLLQEERLLGATLLGFANKQDLPGVLSTDKIKNVRKLFFMNTPQHPVVMQKVQADGKTVLHFFFFSSPQEGSRLHILKPNTLHSSLASTNFSHHSSPGGANLNRIFGTLFKTKYFFLFPPIKVLLSSIFSHPQLSRKFSTLRSSKKEETGIPDVC